MSQRRKLVTGTRAENVLSAAIGNHDMLSQPRARRAGALQAFVDAQVSKSRDEILAMRDPLKGFEAFGRFGQANARDPLTCAYEEVNDGSLSRDSAERIRKILGETVRCW